MESSVNRKNEYTCQSCKQNTVTVDRDEGTTPFMISCQATKGCTGPMYSQFYMCPKDGAPTHEWYNPGEEERKTLSKALLEDHVMRGGLLLRRISRKENE